jgi:hexosaminidase
MLDVSRHWMPMAVVLRNLDAMAAVKLNVFHWHLSDDQGFRVESKLYPRLQQFGSDGHFYSQSEIRAVVEYARDRGIRVVPEFDIPGHTLSWFPGYPDLASGPGPYEIGRHFGIFDPVMDPSRESIYEFLDGFLGEMASLFPDAFFHIGGDEVNGKQWAQSPGVQAFAKQHGLGNTLALQLYFSQRVHRILTKYGKTMMGWDEILQPDLGPDTVIQTWRNPASLAESIRSGYRGILSWGYYLDHLSPARTHYAVDPQGGAAAELTPEQASRILGGEACMWAELVDSEMVDSRVWPRTAAIAERFWSAREITDADSMCDRLEAVSRQLEWTGVKHRANYLPMLDRLAGNRPAPAVRVLADAVEGLGLALRHSSHYTTATPHNRLADAARPDNESIRALEQAAAKAAANPTAETGELHRAFAAWAANDAAFEALAKDNALLGELETLSRNLSALGETGLKALEYLRSGKPAPPGWVAAQSAELSRMAKPEAEVSLAAVRPVKVLLDKLTR